jgi:hypothetical protein
MYTDECMHGIHIIMYHARLCEDEISTIKEIQSTLTHALCDAYMCTLIINRIHSHML